MANKKTDSTNEAPNQDVLQPTDREPAHSPTTRDGEEFDSLESGKSAALTNAAREQANSIGEPSPVTSSEPATSSVDTPSE